MTFVPSSSRSSGGGGAPTDASYYVGASNPDLSAEVVLPAYMQTLLDDVSAAAAKATLQTPFANVTGYKTDRWYACTPMNAGSSAGVTNGTAYAIPFICWAPFTADAIAVYQTAAGAATSVCRLGIYADSGQGMPGSLVLDAGTFDHSTGTNVVKSIAISQALTPGSYWLVVVPQVAAGGSLLCSSAATTGLFPSSNLTTLNTAMAGVKVTGVSGALPGTFSASPTDQITGAPLMWLRSA